MQPCITPIIPQQMKSQVDEARAPGLYLLVRVLGFRVSNSCKIILEKEKYNELDNTILLEVLGLRINFPSRIVGQEFLAGKIFDCILSSAKSPYPPLMVLW